MTVVTERETEIAKEQLKKRNKSLALLALKKRNYQNSLLEKTQNQLFTLEQLVQSIEFAQVEAQVVHGLKAGNAILTEISQEIRIEDVERLMEDTAEAVAYQNEVSRLFAGTELASHIDEDELLEELEGLKKQNDYELESKQSLDLPIKDESISDTNDIVLPSVPTHPIVFVDSEVVQPNESESNSLATKDRQLVTD